MVTTLALLLMLAQAGQQTPTQLVDQIDSASKALRSQIPPGIVTPDQLQAALDAGGTIRLQGGVVYPGSFVARVNGTVILGNGASLTGSTTGPALDITASDVYVSDLAATTSHAEAVFTVGRNDSTQTDFAKVPRRITFARVSIPTYRGKNGWAIHGASVTMDHSSCADLWSPALVESHCLWIGNTPGPVSLIGGSYGGGSVAVFVGGDLMKIAGVVPSDILLDGVLLNRPLSWQTDGVHRGLKGLFEAKTGNRITVRNSVLDGAWTDAQQGFAVVLTPRSGGYIKDVLFEDDVITHASTVLQLMGLDYAVTNPVTPFATANVVFRRVTSTVSKAAYGGFGAFAIVSGEAHDLTVENCVHAADGPTFIDYSLSQVRDPVTGEVRPGGPMTVLNVRTSTWPAGLYGIRSGGYSNGAQGTPPAITVMAVVGNTISGANATLKKNLPLNTYQ